MGDLRTEINEALDVFDSYQIPENQQRELITSGIHFDYLRYPGNAYKTSGGTEAINKFVQLAVAAIRNINSKVIKIQIESNKDNMNNIIGHKKENFEKLKDTYAVIAKFKENKNLKGDKFTIKVIKTA